MERTFDRLVGEYDRWYDMPAGKSVFDAELSCIRSVCGHRRGRWLEIGTGSGRFAAELGIPLGLDPSRKMLEIAGSRGVWCVAGVAEKLPFPDGFFDGILMALTFCFVDDPKRSLEEAHRVLSAGGILLLGIVPAESAWGREYISKASAGHPIYASARILETAEVSELTRSTGFRFVDAASTLFREPGDKAEEFHQVKTGIVPGAGFISMSFSKVSQ